MKENNHMSQIMINYRFIEQCCDSSPRLSYATWYTVTTRIEQTDEVSSGLVSKGVTSSSLTWQKLGFSPVNSHKGDFNGYLYLSYFVAVVAVFLQLFLVWEQEKKNINLVE